MKRSASAMAKATTASSRRASCRSRTSSTAPSGRSASSARARGREPGLRLDRDGRMVELREWGAEVLAQCRTIAAALDSAHGGTAYRAALSAAAKAVEHPESLPSARVLAEMRERYENSYSRF